jgi:PAS domain S-box-containing protein
MTTDPLARLDFRSHPEVLAELLDAAEDGVFSVDAAGTLVAWSAGAERITGHRPDHVLGRGVEILDRRDCTGFSSLRPLLAAPRPEVARQQCHLVTRDGRRLHVEGVVKVVDDGADNVVGAVVIFRDRSELFDGARVAERPAPDVGMVGMVGKSRAMQEVFRKVRLAAASDVTTLITGESGTGKELCAKAIHRLSSRREHPFAALNCSAIPESLLESELFGHVAGAFTGATGPHDGLFAAAGGGVLFLDEIGDVSPLIQVKLLRVLQERRVRPVGSSQERPVDVRLLAATNRDLRQLLAEGSFREDFYYRIRVFEIALPPLRERPEDVVPLAEAFLQEMRPQSGKRVRGFSEDAIAHLERHRWPGNVRELRNVVEHALVVVQGDRITPLDLPDELRLVRGARRPLPTEEPLTPDQLTERATIVAVLDGTGWNRTHAAKRLGYSRVTLWKKMRRYRIDEGIFRRG